MKKNLQNSTIKGFIGIVYPDPNNKKIMSIVVEQNPVIVAWGFMNHVGNICDRVSSLDGVISRMRKSIPTSAKMANWQICSFATSHLLSKYDPSSILQMPGNIEGIRAVDSVTREPLDKKLLRRTNLSALLNIVDNKKWPRLCIK